MGFFSKLMSSLQGPKVDFQEKIKNGAVVIDVRSPGEFSMGHAKGSKNIPLQNIAKQASKLKGKEVILVCRSGARAGQARAILAKNEINVHNAGAWQNVNY